MVKRPAELAVTLGLLAVAVAAFAASWASVGGVNAASNDQPMRLPRILLVLWTVLALACAGRAALVPAASGTAPSTARAGAGRVTAFAVVLLMTAVSLPLLGYLLPVTIGLAILLWLLGERSPVRFAVALLLLGPGLWAVFHHGLGMRLPLLISGGAF
ncbi:hypothetical protein CBW24_05835 [Pacificitalea manganoxidans]|uniref:DUF1468 domain-containing protein n=1 Tax=Pacificitalea manganoxidans TaxID=1411902 RepID=A0A291LYH7_9RHOB|nr:tripartite tricarboxylate transporter TctB family protein [Pacificitalea manganoxidans]ATI41568.1 hypothetical protein CBW24_05835 [Pacificitalea manganoxidans]MDR6308994.1 hypothetical protein [Pacificitalea manganoxidans]